MCRALQAKRERILKKGIAIMMKATMCYATIKLISKDKEKNLLNFVEEIPLLTWMDWLHCSTGGDKPDFIFL